jgi:hypothetical protein
MHAAPHTDTRPAPPRQSLDGVWGSNFIMPLEATPATPNLIASEAEAKAIAAAVGGAISNAIALDPEVPWLVRNSMGLPIVRGQRRTRLIVQPLDGQAPYTAAARKEVEAGPRNAPRDNPEQRPSAERCLVGGGQAPMTALSFAGALLQILVTRDNVVLHTAFGGDVRIVPLTVTHGPKALASRLGDSIGHWEGPTLVIETVGLPDADRFRLFPFLIVSGDAKVIERLTPISDRELLYQFTVIDPKTYTAPWLAEFSWFRTDRPLLEYACHEGNYSLPDILAGARYEEAAAKTAAASGAR